MSKVGDKHALISVDYRGLQVPHEPGHDKGHRDADSSEKVGAGHTRRAPAPTSDSTGHGGEAKPASQVLTELFRAWAPPGPDFSSFRSSGRSVGAGDVDGIARKTGEVGIDGVFATPAVLSDGRTLVVGSHDGKVHVLRLEYSGELKKLDEFETGGGESSPVVAPDGQTVLVGSKDGKVYSLRIADDGVVTKVGEFATGQEIASTPCICPDGRTVIACNESGVVHALRLGGDGSLEKMGMFKGPDQMRSSPCVTPDGRTVVVGSGERIVSLRLDAEGTLSKAGSFRTKGWVSSSPTLSPDGDAVLVGSADGHVYALGIRDDGSLYKMAAFQTDEAVDASPSFSPDGHTVVVGSRGLEGATLYALRFFRSGEMGGFYETGQFMGGSGFKSSAVFSRDGRSLVVGCNDDNVYHLAIDHDGELTKVDEFRTRGWVYSTPVIMPDGTVIAASYDNRVYALRGEL